MTIVAAMLLAVIVPARGCEIPLLLDNLGKIHAAVFSAFGLIFSSGVFCGVCNLHGPRVYEERARGITANTPIPYTDLELLLGIFTVCLIVDFDLLKHYFQWKIATSCYSICLMTIVAAMLLAVIVPATKGGCEIPLLLDNLVKIHAAVFSAFGLFFSSGVFCGVCNLHGPRVYEERARGITANTPIPYTDLELLLGIFTVCLIVDFDLLKHYFQWKIATSCYSICLMTIVAAMLLAVIVPATKGGCEIPLLLDNLVKIHAAVFSAFGLFFSSGVFCGVCNLHGPRVYEERARGITANTPIPYTDLELLLGIFTVCLIVDFDLLKHYFQWKIATSCYSICLMTIVAAMLLAVIVLVVKEKIAAALRN
ncbi:hypothetical protein OROHE_027030 [Orobanche hederae]